MIFLKIFIKENVIIENFFLFMKNSKIICDRIVVQDVKSAINLNPIKK